jgi:hypothetical protein
VVIADGLLVPPFAKVLPLPRGEYQVTRLS